MNAKLRQLLSLALLTANSLANANCSSNLGTSCGNTILTDTVNSENCLPQTVKEEGYGQTFLSLRPAHSDMARDMMGTDSRIHHFGKVDLNGDVSLALQWQQSNSSIGMGEWFFFNGSNAMTYGPNWDSQKYNIVDVNSLNFATTASGTITASPRVEELIADFQFYFGWDEFAPGLWTRVGIPVNYIRTDMRLIDSVSIYDANAAADATGAFNCFNQGDFTNIPLVPYDSNTANTVPFPNLAAAWVGNNDNNLVGAGDWDGRFNGNINGPQTDASVSGLVLEAGYDVWRQEAGHLGFSARLVVPTGSVPTTNYLFDAVVGNTGCFELGAGLTSAYELYNDSDSRSLNFYLNMNATHLFSRKQKRMMGLTGLRNGSTNGSTLPSPGAPWLILAQYNANGFYNGSLVSAADLTSLVVKIHNTVMVDLAATIKYCSSNYGFEVGYNFWVRTKDVATNREASAFANNVNYYGVKPASGNHGSATILDYNVSQSVANLSESNISSTGATITSVTPSDIFAQCFTDANISVCPALQPTTMSNKVFASLEYNWNDSEWEPYLLLGATYEVGCKFNEIKNSSVNQWSVIAKGGLAF